MQVCWSMSIVQVLSIHYLYEEKENIFFYYDTIFCLLYYRLAMYVSEFEEKFSLIKIFQVIPMYIFYLITTQ